MVNGSSDKATEAAEFVVSTWGGWPLAMRFLRDRDLAAGDIDTVLDRYEVVFPALFDEQLPEISAVDFHAAIDLAFVLQQTGRRERAGELIQRSLRFLNGLPGQDCMGGASKVRAYSILGQHEMALEALEDVVAAGCRSNWQAELEHDLALAELRELPGYQEIVAIIREDMAEQRAALAAAGDN